MSSNRLGAWSRSAAMSLLVMVSGFGTMMVHAREDVKLQKIEITQLPPQGQQVMVLISQGGPFKYSKDGTVFGNRERILAPQPRGYYREYTVRTPGEKTRGARRIVCGGQQVTVPDACFYTEDHYASFRQIVR